MMKVCGRCKQEKPTTAFHGDASRRDGLRGPCRDCDAITEKKRQPRVRVRRRESLDADLLRAMLSYDPETGVFTWKDSPNAIWNGKTAGALRRDGYWRISIHGTIHQAHRLVFLYVLGIMPPEEVDHINGNRGDNRLSNLRMVDRVTNMQNTGVRRNSRSGFVGVSHCKSGKWRASIRHQDRTHTLGYFDTPEEAQAAYIAAKAQIHPGFVRHIYAPETLRLAAKTTETP